MAPFLSCTPSTATAATRGSVVPGGLSIALALFLTAAGASAASAARTRDSAFSPPTTTTSNGSTRHPDNCDRPRSLFLFRSVGIYFGLDTLSTKTPTKASALPTRYRRRFDPVRRLRDRHSPPLRPPSARRIGSALCESKAAEAADSSAAMEESTFKYGPVEHVVVVDNDDDKENARKLPLASARSGATAYEKLRHPSRSLVESHAIFGPLLGPGKIERYNVYRRRWEDDGEEENYENDDDNVDNNNGGGGGGGEGHVNGNGSSDAGSERGTRRRKEVAIADVRIGRKLDGHDGIVHGGITCLIFDDAMGWGYDALVITERKKARKTKKEERKKKKKDGTVDMVKVRRKGVSETDNDQGDDDNDDDNDDDDEDGIDPMTIVTANLNVNFRSPLPAGTDAIVRIYHDGTVGRKIYFSAILEGTNDGKRTLFSDATALFVIPKDAAATRRTGAVSERRLR